MRLDVLRQTLALADRDRKIGLGSRFTTRVVALRIQPQFRRDRLFADHNLNATLRGLHESMQNLDQSRPACKPLANKPLRGHRPVRKQAPAGNGKSFLH